MRDTEQTLIYADLCTGEEGALEHVFRLGDSIGQREHEVTQLAIGSKLVGVTCARIKGGIVRIQDGITYMVQEKQLQRNEV